MGSSSSKAVARTASAASLRKYPSRPSGALPSTAPPVGHQDVGPQSQAAATAPRIQPTTDERGPTVHTRTQASSERTAAINDDARDPTLDASLRQLGPVTPFPTFSNSSTSGQQTEAALRANPALIMLRARERIEAAVEQEKADVGRSGFQGREYLDIGMVKRALEMRDLREKSDAEIEETLGLKAGAVAKLGRRGVVEVA